MRRVCCCHSWSVAGEGSGVTLVPMPLGTAWVGISVEAAPCPCPHGVPVPQGHCWHWHGSQHGMALPHLIPLAPRGVAVLGDTMAANSQRWSQRGEGEAIVGLAEAKEQGQLPTDVAASHWRLLVSNLILWLNILLVQDE